jgi:hypothetical protein
MRTGRSLLLCLSIAAAMAIPTHADDPKQAGFVSMFDGRTLDGWEVIPPKAAKAWTATDGKIVGDGDNGRCYLQYTKNKQIADFEMKFSYRLPSEGNSGVNIRSRQDETDTREFQSYHADIGHIGIGKNILGAWDFHTPGREEHGCPRGSRLVIDKDDNAAYVPIENSLTVEDVHDKDWNTAHIIATGNNFKFYLNGKLTAEFTEHLPPERRLDRGSIELQLHDPGMVVEFKDLQIKVVN